MERDTKLRVDFGTWRNGRKVSGVKGKIGRGMDGAFPESGPGRDHRRRDLSFSYVSSETADKKFLLRLLLLLLLLPLTISRTLSWQWLHLPCRRCLHRRGAWRRRSSPPSLRSPCLASVTSSSRIGSGVGEAKNLRSFFALAPLTPLLSPYAPVNVKMMP